MAVLAEPKKDAAVISLPGGYTVEVSPAVGNYEVKIVKSGDVSEGSDDGDSRAYRNVQRVESMGRFVTKACHVVIPPARLMPPVTMQGAKSVDPIGNFPTITDKHRSLTCKALRADPALYAKYANVKTPMGFTFDQAIQAGLDAPHLGVGIAAGEAAAYTTYKDIMDIVIEGWHGYKPTDSHQSDMDFEKIKMTPAQVRRAELNKGLSTLASSL